ncbi:CLUMA_CG013798, isoform A [Clunio marinus]|uniref:DNA-directed RNA polymerase n=1 Tax=Clunio marinus TaxID=568069 RepID=A0A1J1IPV8_9DIPT|nr:CLUMA_CG013798, isoform A [Clunio marinus]
MNFAAAREKALATVNKHQNIIEKVKSRKQRNSSKVVNLNIDTKLPNLEENYTQDNIDQYINVLRKTNRVIAEVLLPQRLIEKAKSKDIAKSKNINSIKERLLVHNKQKKSSLKQKIKEMRRQEVFPLPKSYMNYQKRNGILKKNSIKINIEKILKKNIKNLSKMHRLLGFHSVSNAKLLLSRRKIIESSSDVHLLFNQKPQILTLSDGVIHKNYSSNKLSSEMLKRLTKRKKKPHKKYTELLQVTNNSTKQTTTAIQKLKAEKLAAFINEANFEKTPKEKSVVEAEDKVGSTSPSVKELNNTPIVFVTGNTNEMTISKEKYQEIIESFNAFREISENSALGASNVGIAEETLLDESATDEINEAVEEEIYEDESELPIKPINKKPSKTKVTKEKSRFKGKYFESFEKERAAKQKYLTYSLKAYLECCVNIGMINRAYYSIINHRYKSSHSNNSSSNHAIKLTDVCLYNTLIHGYAERENLQKVQELMNIIKEDKIQPNAQTFANFLECLGRILINQRSMEKYHLNADDLIKLVNQTLDEASHHNLSANDLIDKSFFLQNHREFVISAIQLVIKDFQPLYTPPDLLYHNKMLDNLNQNVQDVTVNPLNHLDEKVSGSEIMNSKIGFDRQELETLGREQLEAELTGYVTIKSIEKFPEPTSTVLAYREKIAQLKTSWRDVITMAFNRDLNALKHQEFAKSRGGQNLFPYLKSIELDEFIEILFKEIEMLAQGSETYSPTVMCLYKNLGANVQTRYQMDLKKRNGLLQKTGEIYGSFCDILSSGNFSDNSRQCWQRLIYQNANDGPSLNFTESSWPLAAQIGIGRFLYNILMRDLKIDLNIIRMTKSKQKNENLSPAFFSLFRNQGYRMKEEIKPHPVLVKLFRGSQRETLTFPVNQVPMVCPPQPWTTDKNGGYLLAKSDLIRLPQSARQQIEKIEGMPLCDLYPSLDSLNQLASIPWTVNKDVLDVILKVFNDGGDDKLDVPPLPSSLPPPTSPESTSELTKTQKFEFFRQKLVHRRKQAEMYSLWCDSLYRLSLANHYRDRVFWLPHNMDFRGRVYPIPPHLNHLSSDLARSLLIFHQKKKLGIDGFSWLKLHCINLTGLKKRDSVRERLLYAEEVMNEILDSADHPLDGQMWWTKSDEPWQTLSCCMEIAKVLRSNVEPENYESSYPIHQDGSCNGLQHYAALGRDSDGAFSVNLSPANVPQDVYSGIAQLVEKARQNDENNGIEVAKILRNFVKRKVIKQTVMTTVYGVTRYGAKLQIAKQLKDIEDFPKEWVWSAANYLTIKTFDSLGEIFTSTKEIQDWLTDCARLISTVCGQNVEWVTPLGLPVVQPYSRHDKVPQLTKSATLNTITVGDLFTKPNIMKQRNAFPPNFIHSLDSSHMMLTSLNCEKAGLTFVSVHDCFWTHACTVPEMNKICREQFVELHSQPILEDLSKFMVAKYSFRRKDLPNDGSVNDMAKKKLNRILTMVPQKGDFDLKKVLESVYFFS